MNENSSTSSSVLRATGTRSWLSSFKKRSIATWKRLRGQNVPLPEESRGSFQQPAEGYSTAQLARAMLAAMEVTYKAPEPLPDTGILAVIETDIPDVLLTDTGELTTISLTPEGGAS